MEGPVRSMYMDIVEHRALDGDLYRVTIAANEKVRQPPELEFGGLSTENYSRNPVVMWAHDAVGRSPSGGLPIGRTLNLVKVPGGRIVADFEFLGDDPFAQRVKNAWDKGFLRAASISWIPVDSTPVDGGGWRDTRSDLLEWSIVSVPADPEALRESHRRMLDVFLGEPELAAGATAPGAGDHPSPKAGPRRQPALGLSPDEYDDLSTALTLLRDVVEGLREPARAGDRATLAHTGPNGGSDSDMTEIRSMVGAIKTAVVNARKEL